jgi:hypothetical protein
MDKWLYDSHGHPVAFVRDEIVFSRRGRFLGYMDGDEVWHGTYKGEVVGGDRLLYNRNKGGVIRGKSGIPGSSGAPGPPGSKGTITLPSGFRNVGEIP